MSKDYLYNDCDDCPYCYKAYYPDGSLKVRICLFDDEDIIKHREAICESTEMYYCN